MKNLAMAGAVAAALSLTCLSQQRAAAQDCPQQCMRGGEISINSGISFGVHWTPCHGHWEPNCCGPYGCPIGPYGYAAGPYGSAAGPYGYPSRGYAAAPFAAPQPAPAPAPAPAAPTLPPPTTETTGVQNVGYAYPGSYGYDNGYWYGYPYYQDYGYWYGYGR